MESIYLQMNTVCWKGLSIYCQDNSSSCKCFSRSMDSFTGQSSGTTRLSMLDTGLSSGSSSLSSKPQSKVSFSYVGKKYLKWHKVHTHYILFKTMKLT